MRAQIVGDRFRRHDRRGGEARHVAQSRLMPLEFVDAEIFGKGDRQEIVDEEGRADIPALLQPLEG